MNESKRRMYGNWRQPRRAALGKLSLLSTLVIIAGMMLVTLVMMFSTLKAALVVTAFIVLAVMGVERKDRYNATVAQRLGEHVMWWNRKRRGEHVYRSGPLGKAGWGTCQLPGILASTQLYEYEDGWGRPFAMIVYPKSRLCSVVFASEPDGESLVDQDQIESWVANWGGWLASLGQDPTIQQAQVVIETAPDTGRRLRREIEANVVEGAPELALAMLREVESTYPVGGAQVRAYIALTVSVAGKGGKARSNEEIARDMAARMGTWSAGLAATGAGTAKPMTAFDIVRAVRCAYDPRAEALYDDALLLGETVEVPWSEAGPIATEASWDLYQHDSVFSRTWVMSGAPKGQVFSTVLSRLLAPDSAMSRKRVALLYRPIDPGRAAALVESDANQAAARVESSHRATAAAQSEYAKAESTRFEEAAGAGLEEFGMVITGTVDSREDVREMDDRMASLASSARIIIRPAFGLQDAAFTAALPVGVVVSRFARIPETVGELL